MGKDVGPNSNKICLKHHIVFFQIDLRLILAQVEKFKVRCDIVHVNLNLFVASLFLCP